MGRERDSTGREGAERKRERDRVQSRLQAPSCRHRARRGARTHQLCDQDLSRSQTPHRLSHPGAPSNLCILNAQPHLSIVLSVCLDQEQTDHAASTPLGPTALTHTLPPPLTNEEPRVLSERKMPSRCPQPCGASPPPLPCPRLPPLGHLHAQCPAASAPSPSLSLGFGVRQPLRCFLDVQPLV